MIDSFLIQTVLALAPSGGQGGQGTAPFWVQMFPLFLMIFVFYFIFIRPQQRKARELDTLIKSIKPGDKVVTSSGIVGAVVSVKDRTVSLRSGETKLEILKTAVTEVTERGNQSEPTNT